MCFFCSEDIVKRPAKTQAQLLEILNMSISNGKPGINAQQTHYRSLSFSTHGNAGCERVCDTDDVFIGCIPAALLWSSYFSVKLFYDGSFECIAYRHSARDGAVPRRVAVLRR